MLKHFKKALRELKRKYLKLCFIFKPSFNIGTTHGVIRMTASNFKSWSRARGMLTTEPETIKWLKNLSDKSVFYDIGSNIGVFSVYAASLGAQVFAFDPVPSNYYANVRNSSLNGFAGRVVCLPIGISDRDLLAQSDEALSKVTAGFKADTNFQKKRVYAPGAVRLETTLKNSLDKDDEKFLTLTLDTLVFDLGLPKPHFIKIDVDGPEFSVLCGAKRLFSDPELASVMVEASEERDALKKIIHFMAGFGFDLAEKHYTNPSQASKAFPNFNNFFWRKQ